MVFTAIADFFSDETRSQYAVGLTYTARTEAQMALFMQWAKEGKMRVGGSNRAKIRGAG